MITLIIDMTIITLVAIPPVVKEEINITTSNIAIHLTLIGIMKNSKSCASGNANAYPINKDKYT